MKPDCTWDTETKEGNAFRDNLRSIYKAEIGDVLDTEIVARTCENARCINPEHLDIVQYRGRVLKPLHEVQSMVLDYLYTYGSQTRASRAWINSYTNYFGTGQSTVEYTIHKTMGRHINNRHLTAEFGY